MVLKDFIFSEFKMTEDPAILAQFTDKELEDHAEYLKAIQPIEITKGIFVTLSLNMNHWIEDQIISYNSFTPFNTWEELVSWNAANPDEDHYPFWEENFGVCDTYEQILKLYPLESDPRNFIVVMTPIYKEEQDNGWRQEKWGKYIGSHESHTDYFNNEPNIDVVYVYHIYEVK
jgi:hypothetical protein